MFNQSISNLSKVFGGLAGLSLIDMIPHRFSTSRRTPGNMKPYNKAPTKVLRLFAKFWTGFYHMHKAPVADPFG
jgi:hypothetical protein